MPDFSLLISDVEINLEFVNKFWIQLCKMVRVKENWRLMFNLKELSYLHLKYHYHCKWLTVQIAKI